MDIDQQHLLERGLTYECSDVGNKDRFNDQHGASLKFLREEGRWICWAGDRWSDKNARPYERAEETVKLIHNEARDCKVRGGSRELSKWAQGSQSRSKLEAMLKLASEGLAASVNDFDGIGDEINCLNGIVDLKKGSLTAHSPEQLVMKRADVSYDPAAMAPTWTKFLYDVFSGDDELVDWLQRALGYSLTASVDEQIFFVLYGRGENGKGKLCETMLRIMGDYALPTQFDTFLATDKSNVRALAAVGDLKGVRFALASETESSKKWSEAMMKRLTGGDTLIGAKLYGSHFTFEPTHKLWFQANHLPSFKDATHGFKRRVRVIPFEREFSGGDRDKDMGKKLLAEREGIFAWLVEGARRYYAEGLQDTPAACVRATDDYIHDNDVLSRFIAECMVKVPGHRVGVSDVYGRYCDWCRDEGQEPASMNYFPANMQERGVQKRRTSSGQMFDGYTLRGAARQIPAFDPIVFDDLSPPANDNRRRKWNDPDQIRETEAILKAFDRR